MPMLDVPLWIPGEPRRRAVPAGGSVLGTLLTFAGLSWRLGFLPPWREEAQAREAEQNREQGNRT